MADLRCSIICKAMFCISRLLLLRISHGIAFFRYKRTFELNPAFVEMPDLFEDIIACAIKCVFLIFLLLSFVSS